MTPDQIRFECANGNGRVTLVVPWEPSPSGKIRLAKTKGPFGEVVCVNRIGNTVARFSSAAVLRWLDRQEKIDS